MKKPYAVDVEILKNRREFLEVMGATVGFASLAACVKQPEEQIYPYVRAPEYLVPGKPKYFATSLARSGVGRPALVESHDGHPTKIEGNAEHPASLGGTDVWMQAAIYDLYNPDRSQATLRQGAPSTWKRFGEEVLPRFSASLEGSGCAILTGAVTSPTLAAQLDRLKKTHPKLRWYQWESAHLDERFRATQAAYGRALDVVYDFESADVVVAFDADPLFVDAGSLVYARQAARRRRDADGFTRWYVVEPSPTPTGTFADHRFRARRADVGAWVTELAAALGLQEGETRAAVQAMANDLKAAGKKGVVVVGPTQPADVQALAFRINEHLGARGTTFKTIEPVVASPVDHTEEQRALVKSIEAGETKTILVLGKNPVFDAPADLDFAAAYDKVPLRVHVGAFVDETAHRSHWHLPARHALESWSDTKTFDGTVSLVQPLLRPLYGGHSAHELIELIAGRAGRREYAIVREHYEAQWGAALESRWRRALHDGFVANTQHAEVTTAPKVVDVKPRAVDGLELTFEIDGTVWDGSYADNPWLQELPKPITKLTWDNAALVSPATAGKLGVETDDVVEIEVEGRKVDAAVFVLPGQAEDSLALSLGNGRRRGSRVGRGVGFDAQRARPSDKAWFTPAKVRSIDRVYTLVTTQDHHRMEGRNLVREATLAAFASDDQFAKRPDAKVAKLSLYPEHPREGEQWGLTVNLNACNGCNACVVACQSENNIPVVGKEQVANGREMHWIRIDSYFEGDETVHNQPVTCMHCENAPCEVVCPANATVHSPSGINEMVYNRCIGTRYCSNNCPYKVRRFNFLLYQDWETPSLEPMRNPDVSVRSRGVMEKCTFCIQRIQAARITARKEDREVRDGEIVTACQGACPAEAISFGDIADPESKVSKAKADARDYVLLHELNAKPRVSYTAKLTNPNPAIDEKVKG
ncbi:MAG: 4Fe-4S dicluster domain-containing protein [Deltaproteobacteria bacterium]